MRKKGLKIATIGGGSSYTPELIEGFIKRYDQLPVEELWLVDIEDGKEKLEIVGNLAKRMVEKAGIPMKIQLTLDRREAIKNADFVTTQLRVGLLDARILDERIPLKHGIIGQETNGPGGLFKGLRTIPVILDIIKDVEELANPNAWIINFANPSGMVTEAVFRHTNFKRFIGLCNVPIGVQRRLAEAMKVDAKKLEIDFAGLNHMVFGLKAHIDGEDVMNEALKVLGDSGNQLSMENIDALAWDPDFVKTLGVIPCPYHRYYYKQDQMLDKQLKDFKKGKTRAEVVKEVEAELFELYKDPDLNIKPPQLEKRGGAYYSDAACDLITSIYNDKRDIQVVNTVNHGAISNLPYESAIEISAVITKEGPKPIAVGELPDQVIGLVRGIKSFEQLGSDAAITGDYNKALLAMTINPLVPSDETARIILDEMLEAHKKYLLQFK